MHAGKITHQSMLDRVLEGLGHSIDFFAITELVKTGLKIDIFDFQPVFGICAEEIE